MGSYCLPIKIGTLYLLTNLGATIFFFKAEAPATNTPVQGVSVILGDNTGTKLKTHFACKLR